MCPKRYASHYVCYHEAALPDYVKEIICRDRSLLSPVCGAFLSSHPEYTGGFTYCILEMSGTGELIRLLPFTEEIESTEWHPGILNLSDFITR